ncbi:MAG TPA: hypothetical protein VHD88_04330 [Pyrinomonadaceae bacterium]|nr:hypothetical protein [Pyrinomonadaceae bacterium]
MEELKRTYVVDEQNHRVAVQIDIETFNRIEEALENSWLPFYKDTDSATLIGCSPF